MYALAVRGRVDTVSEGTRVGRRRPLWPERTPFAADFLASEFGISLPEWEELEAIAREGPAGRPRGELGLPPRSVPSGRSPAHRFGNWEETAPERANPGNVFDFAALPPMRRYFRAAGRVLTGGTGAPPQPVLMGLQFDLLTRWRWRQAGRPVVSLTLPAADRLLRHPVTDRPLGELPVTAPSIYLLLPPDFLSFTDLPGKPLQTMEGVFVMCDRPAPSPDVRRLWTWWAAGETGAGQREDNTLFTFAVLGPSVRLEDVSLEKIESFPVNREARLGLALPRLTMGVLAALQPDWGRVEGFTVATASGGSRHGVEYVLDVS